MFFDPDFVPVNYVDQLFTTILGDCSNPTVYDNISKSSISNDVSNLITNLDYYTQELSANDKLQQLQDCTNLLNDNTTRLQYYTNILTNSIVSLQQDLASVNKLVTINENNQSVQSLVQLKLVKKNLQLVLTIFENLFIALQQKLSITPSQFEKLLNEITDESTVGEFEDLKGIFNNLSKFNPIYKKWWNSILSK